MIDEAEIRRNHERLTAGEDTRDTLADDVVFNQTAEMPGTAGTSSGVPTEAPLCHLTRYDEQGLLKRLDVHGDWDEARRAAAEDSW